MPNNIAWLEKIDIMRQYHFKSYSKEVSVTVYYDCVLESVCSILNINLRFSFGTFKYIVFYFYTQAKRE